MLGMIVGTFLAVGALAFVLAPLVRGAAGVAGAGAPVPSPEASALEALREIEFDHSTGKLSEGDYAALKATYAPRALAELDARAAAVKGTVRELAGVAAGAAPGAGSGDAAEALITRMRTRGTACPEHGARPEGDALYCSDCGRFLSATCLRCGAAVEDARARFCGECGAGLAA